MEALIHHFKLVTEGFTVPAGTGLRRRRVTPRGAGLPRHLRGTNKPYRVRVRDPSFIHIGTIPAVHTRPAGRRRDRRRRLLGSRHGRRRSVKGHPRVIEEKAQGLVDRYPVGRSALLPLLHLVQHAGRATSPTRASRECAQLLGLTKAEVAAVATFYTMYKREPLGPPPGQRLHELLLQGARRAARSTTRSRRTSRRRPQRDHRGRRDHAGARGVPGQLRRAPRWSASTTSTTRCLDAEAAIALVDQVRAGRSRRPRAGYRLAGHPRRSSTASPASARCDPDAPGQRLRPAPTKEDGARPPSADSRPRRPLRCPSWPTDGRTTAPLSTGRSPDRRRRRRSGRA